MKFKNTMISVKDMEASKAFYGTVLGLHVIADWGANVTLTGGLCLQTEDTWKGFIRKQGDIVIGDGAELYFEEDNFDAFLQKLERMDGIDYVHEAVEFPWGQRGIRLRDPDGHIIEVGENMKSVAKRFLDSGMTEEQIAVRMDVPVKTVKAFLR